MYNLVSFAHCIVFFRHLQGVTVNRKCATVRQAKETGQNIRTIDTGIAAGYNAEDRVDGTVSLTVPSLSYRSKKNYVEKDHTS